MSASHTATWFIHRPAVKRTRQIARVLAGHGLGNLVDLTGLTRFAPPLVSRPVRHAPLTTAQRLRAALGELGVTFIKLGQTLSTRADLLPADFVEELSKLQDAAPHVAIARIREAIEADLGRPPEAVFATFDPQPMASASIGQVHSATLPNGAPVVVKVRRPGVVEEVESDLEILFGIARWVEAHTEFGHDHEITPFVEEFAFTIRNELDYRVEGQNADRLRRFLAGDPAARIPFVYWEHTTSRVLTLERIDGVKISDLDTIDRLRIPRRAIAKNAVHVFLHTLLDLGLFHADPHPGNFFAQPDGSLGVVDFGMVGHLTEQVREHLLRAGLAAMHMDADSLAEELYALGVAGRHADRRAFLRDLEHVLTRFGGLSLEELSATEITAQVTAIVQRHKLQLPSELALLFRVVAMSEGVGLKLDPEFHYLENASPYFARRWKETHSAHRTMERAAGAAIEGMELSMELPRRTGRLLGRIERGEIEINIRHEGLDSVTSQFQRMTNRLALAVVLAASVVALGVALGIHRLGGIERYLDWLFTLGFLGSLAFGAWLLLSIWRAGKR